MLVEVFYGKVGFMRDACLGSKWLRARNMLPTIHSFHETHEQVYQVEVSPEGFSIETLFYDLNVNPDKINSDNFKPEDSSVWHQSITIGDIIRYQGATFMIDFSGLKKLE